MLNVLYSKIFPQLQTAPIHVAINAMIEMLRLKVRLPVLLCAVKTVEGDSRFCWMISPNVGQTHKENPNLVRIFCMTFTLNDIYKQYNNYTNIDSQKSVHFAVPRTETRLKMHQTCI